MPGDAVQQAQLSVSPFQRDLCILVVGDVLVRPEYADRQAVIISFHFYAYDQVTDLAVPADDPVFQLVDPYLGD